MFSRNVKAEVQTMAPLPEKKPGKRFYGQSGNQSNEISNVMTQPGEVAQSIPRRKEFATLQQAREQQNNESYSQPNYRQEGQQGQPQSQDFSQSKELGELVDIKIQILNQQKIRLEDLKQQQLYIQKEIYEQEKEIDETLNDLQTLTQAAPSSQQNNVKVDQPLKSRQQRVNSQQGRRDVPTSSDRQMISRAKNAFQAVSPGNNSMQQVMNQPDAQQRGFPPSANTLAEMRRNKQSMPESSGKINDQVHPQNALVANRIYKGSAKIYKDTKDLIG